MNLSHDTEVFALEGLVSCERFRAGSKNWLCQIYGF